MAELRGNNVIYAPSSLRLPQKLSPHKSTPLWQDSRFHDLVRTDLESMERTIDLDLEEGVARVLLVQSVMGHAQNGHGEFGKAGYVYPDATIPDIIAGAGMDIQRIKAARQQLVDDVYEWVDKALEGSATRLVLRGKPLLGVKFLRHHGIDPEYVLKGMVLAGYMDNFNARMDTIDHFKTTIKGDPLIIGGGETYLVDMNALVTAGLNIPFLEQQRHDEESIQYLRDLGVIVQKFGRGNEQAYFRRKIGPGTSDDLAFIMVGKLYGQQDLELGISAMLGAFVVDAIDTYDKCVSFPVQNGLDERLAEYIQLAWKEEHDQPLVSQEEIRTIIYYSAKSNNPRVSASSSHRRFVQFGGDEQYKPALEAHVYFVMGREPDPFHIGFEGTPSQVFYPRAQKRADHMLLQKAA